MDQTNTDEVKNVVATNVEPQPNAIELAFNRVKFLEKSLIDVRINSLIGKKIELIMSKLAEIPMVLAEKIEVKEKVEKIAAVKEEKIEAKEVIEPIKEEVVEIKEEIIPIKALELVKEEEREFFIDDSKLEGITIYGKLKLDNTIVDTSIAEFIIHHMYDDLFAQAIDIESSKYMSIMFTGNLNSLKRLPKNAISYAVSVMEEQYKGKIITHGVSKTYDSELSLNIYIMFSGKI